jgi:hypothetical protein
MNTLSFLHATPVQYIPETLGWDFLLGWYVGWAIIFGIIILLGLLCHHRKVGGIHFVTLGRLGFNFYIRRKSHAENVSCDSAFVDLRSRFALWLSRFNSGNETERNQFLRHLPANLRMGVIAIGIMASLTVSASAAGTPYNFREIAQACAIDLEKLHPLTLPWFMEGMAGRVDPETVRYMFTAYGSNQSKQGQCVFQLMTRQAAGI